MLKGETYWRWYEQQGSHVTSRAIGLIDGCWLEVPSAVVRYGMRTTPLGMFAIHLRELTSHVLRPILESSKHDQS